ncbi:hypothetical protein [Microbulbifer variabilis]|uniref:hypothetical protein n=1 Tax=Microbulbifer variabilis TaxID=266805 RepID=UPI000382CD6C|nr:hypothetical protein [Microbulbifer variabilis]
MRKAAIIIIPLIALAVWFGKPMVPYYQQSPIHLTVLDADTQMPVQGAVVVARWTVSKGWFQTYNAGAFELQEALSDSEGKVLLPGFDKRWWPWFSNSFIPARQPEIVVFKYKYVPERYLNSYDSQSSKPGLRDLSGSIEWKGKKTLNISALPDDPSTRFQKFMGLSRNPLPFLIPALDHGCTWTKMKHMIIEYDKQMHEGEKLGLLKGPAGPWYMPPEKTAYSGDCPGGIEWIEAQRAVEF